MIRIIVENLLLFLLPTFIYLAWVVIASRPSNDGASGGAAAPIRPLNEAPLLWLFCAGAFLVLVTLAAFESTSGGKPGQHYIPPSMKDGAIQPGHLD